jgi:hypothetical protein
MGGHPLLKVGVGGGKVKVIEGVVAVVERSAGEGGVDGKEWVGQEKEQKCGEDAAPGEPDRGLRERCNHDEHSFLLPHLARALGFDSAFCGDEDVGRASRRWLRAAEGAEKVGLWLPKRRPGETQS